MGRPWRASHAVSGSPQLARRPPTAGRACRTGPAARPSPRPGSATVEPARPSGPGHAGRRGRPAQLDDRQPGRQGARHVQLEPGAVGGDGVDRGRQGRRGVDDQEVARPRETGAGQRTGRARCRPSWRQADQQPHLVPAQAPRFGWLRRLERLAGSSNSTTGSGAEQRWSRRHRHRLGPVSAARQVTIDQASRPGTATSGGGRSEMSSPGNASWCSRVRRSPGSTQ